MGNYVTPASRSSPSFRRRSGSQRISRRPNSTRCGRAERSKISVDAYPQLDLKGHVDSIQMGRAPNSPLFRPRTRPAISSRSCSACRSRSSSTAGSIPNLPLPLGISVVPTVKCNERRRRHGAQQWKPSLQPWLIAVVGHARGLHGDSRHDDRQCRVAAYRGQPVGEQRRGDLDADLLSGRQRHRADDFRLARRPVRP